eukprot:2263467-Pleurochrysis_carterae.AAC.1
MGSKRDLYMRTRRIRTISLERRRTSLGCRRDGQRSQKEGCAIACKAEISWKELSKNEGKLMTVRKHAREDEHACTKANHLEMHRSNLATGNLVALRTRPTSTGRN